MKYTADDLLKALKHCLYKMPYEQYAEFKASLMGVDKEDLDALSEKGVFTLADELGVEKFLDVYNECLNNFKNTLHVGDVYRIIDTERPSCYGCDRIIVLDYDEEEDRFHSLSSNGDFNFVSNGTFNFDNAEKIGSIDAEPFIQSMCDLINKANEL